METGDQLILGSDADDKLGPRSTTLQGITYSVRLAAMAVARRNANKMPTQMLWRQLRKGCRREANALAKMNQNRLQLNSRPQRART
jgi:hypothetical protein